jgi:hypothetical protein
MEDEMPDVRIVLYYDNHFDYSLLEMIPVWHITPTNDLEPHNEWSVQEQDPADPIRWKFIGCECKCKPTIKKVNESILVIHNSFDGREGVEWTNEILNDK